MLFNAFLKQFKTGDVLSNFLAQLQKLDIEKMLKGEVDANLGYDEYQKITASNTRNGFSSKRVKTSFWGIRNSGFTRQRCFF